MSKTPLRILGIRPGTRYLGFAFFRGTELVDWGVKVSKGKWSKKKLRRIVTILSKLQNRYKPNTLALKRLHPSRSSANLKTLVNRIRQSAKAKRLKLCQYSIGELETFFAPKERIGKKQLAELVAMEQPVLQHLLGKEKANRNPYHIRAFEAVALASMCHSQLDHK